MRCRMRERKCKMRGGKIKLSSLFLFLEERFLLNFIVSLDLSTYRRSLKLQQFAEMKRQVRITIKNPRAIESCDSKQCFELIVQLGWN